VGDPSPARRTTVRPYARRGEPEGSPTSPRLTVRLAAR
jgi:hypothetical protein